MYEELKAQLLRSEGAPGWKRVGVFPHHGIDVFLPALHSENSSGIGEFLDLLPLIDWCQSLKIDVIQLLPLNNGDHDPSPYNPLSSCALNYLYLSLKNLPHFDEHPSLKKKQRELSKFNKSRQIPFTEVLVHKLGWLQSYYEHEGKSIEALPEYKQFVRENEWLTPYALFRALKDHMANTPWVSWPNEQYRDLLRRYTQEIAFYSTLQFLCYTQLKTVRSYANQRGILLMGDVPILVGRESADVWANPKLFKLEFSAGAPPDKYQPEGQCWGFPLYNWDALREEHFLWWKQRLTYASHFYDLFRIDHIVGFFRIWAVAEGFSSKEGLFIPQDETLWESQGKERLQTILSFANHMLAIGEDLGTVPEGLRPCMEELGICCTKVMRWERYWEEDGRFIPPQYYSPVSLTCVSTHDSETLAQWWMTFPEEAQEFARFKNWEYSPELTRAQRHEILWDAHHTPSLFHINLLQEYLALFPELVWPDPAEERINQPGTVLPTNWVYRYRPSVEELVGHADLALAMRKILFSPSPLL